MRNVGIPGDYGLKGTDSAISNCILEPAATCPVEQFALRKEGLLSASGAVVVNTGRFTGRSPMDKFLVLDSVTEPDSDVWWGRINQPFASDQFNRLLLKMNSYVQHRDVFVQDMTVGAHPLYNLPIRIISENAWASLFAHNLFRRVPHEVSKRTKPLFIVLHFPGFQADPTQDGRKVGHLSSSAWLTGWY